MNANYAFVKITFQYLGYKHNMKMMVKLHGLLCNVGFHVSACLYCCEKRRCRFYLLAYKFCFNRSLLMREEKMQILSARFQVLFQQVSTAVRREDADFICQLISFVSAGLYCCKKRRCRFYLLAYKFCFSRPLLL